MYSCNTSCQRIRKQRKKKKCRSIIYVDNYISSYEKWEKDKNHLGVWQSKNLTTS